MHQALKPVQLKLDRAHEFANKLLNLPNLSSDLKSESHTELLPERKGFRCIIDDIDNFQSLDAASIDLSAFVHMLRSSLDNLAFALARLKKDPPTKPVAMHFPILESETDFAEKKVTNCLSQMDSEAGKKIQGLQPFQRGRHPEIGDDGNAADDPLLVLQKLSNMDKHQVPAVALFGQLKQGHDHIVEFYSDEDASANVPPDSTISADPLRPGLVMIEYRTNRPIKSATGKISIDANLMIAIDSGWLPFEQTIRLLSWYVGLVVDQFRPFFKD